MTRHWLGGSPRRLLSVLAGVPVVVLAAGCAVIPSAGSVQATPTPSAPGVGGSSCCALLFEGPQKGWSAEEIVSNFLLASASFTQDYAIARKYLTPAASRNWHPQSPVTVVADHYQLRTVPQRPGPSIVTVTSQQVGTLDANGQYLLSGPSATSNEQNFGLERNKDGQLRISSLPGLGKVSHELLLTESLFHVVYQPRNLYFFAGNSLIPEPVFLPGSQQNPVMSMLDGLRKNPGGWLEGAASTAFPARARVQSVQVLPGPGRTAIVNLTVPADLQYIQMYKMAEQVVWTLTDTSYSPALFHAVKLKINGRFWPADHPVQALADYRGAIPGWGGDLPLYFAGVNGSVRVSRPKALHSTAVPGEAGSGRLPLGQLAVSPDGRSLAAADGSSTAVYTADLKAGTLQQRLTGSGLSAPSWDSAGDLWVAGRVNHKAGVWVVFPHSTTPVRVPLPPHLGPIRAVSVAPDGVRLAMIAGSGPNARLIMGAIVRGDSYFWLRHIVLLGPALTGVTALAWYDDNHLLAGAGRPDTGIRLCEVPVNGDGALCRAVPGDLVSITAIAAAGPDNPLYLGLSNGRMEESVGLSEPWTDAGEGLAPAYPG